MCILAGCADVVKGLRGCCLHVTEWLRSADAHPKNMPHHGLFGPGRCNNRDETTRRRASPERQRANGRQHHRTHHRSSTQGHQTSGRSGNRPSHDHNDHSTHHNHHSSNHDHYRTCTDHRGATATSTSRNGRTDRRSTRCTTELRVREQLPVQHRQRVLRGVSVQCRDVALDGHRGRPRRPCRSCDTRRCCPTTHHPVGMEPVSGLQPKDRCSLTK